MPEQLDAFLAAGSPPDGAQESAAPPPTESTPTPSEGATEAAAKPAEAKPDAEPEEDAPQHTGSDNRTVPFSALEKVRNDWKSKYAAEQARAELLAKQLEEAKKPPPAPPAAPPQQQFVPPPDPSVDPHGWAAHLVQRNQEVLLNERLNMSESLLRDRMGDEKVDSYVADFKVLATKEPALWNKLYSQSSPYQWLIKEVDRLRMHDEIGNDPAAYRSRIIAEERAKWEQEAAQHPTNGNGRAVSPAAGLPPSLANARSVAGRTQSSFSGPPSMDDILRRPERRR